MIGIVEVLKVGLPSIAETHPGLTKNGKKYGEYRGPCFCGGNDRFGVFIGKDGYEHYKCRQCGIKGDRIEYFKNKIGIREMEEKKALNYLAQTFDIKGNIHKKESIKTLLPDARKEVSLEEVSEDIKKKFERLQNSPNAIMEWLRTQRGIKVSRLGAVGDLRIDHYGGKQCVTAVYRAIDDPSKMVAMQHLGIDRIDSKTGKTIKHPFVSGSRSAHGVFVCYPSETIPKKIDAEILTEGALNGVSFASCLLDMNTTVIKAVGTKNGSANKIARIIKKNPSRRFLIALDKDAETEINAIKKGVGRSHQIGFIDCEDGLDANDVLREKGPDELRKRVEMAVDGIGRKDLLPDKRKALMKVASSMVDAGREIFAYQGRTYRAYRDQENGLHTKQLGDFTIIPAYWTRDVSDMENPVYSMRVVVTPSGGTPIGMTLGGNALMNNPLLGRAFLSRGQVHWAGDNTDLKPLREWLTKARVKTVTRLNLVGNDPTSGYIVHRHFSISPEGQVYGPDKYGCLPIGPKQTAKPPSAGEFYDNQIKIGPGYKPKHPPEHVLKTFKAAYPSVARIMLGYMFASWYAEDLRQKLGAFPFLSIHGMKQTAKSTCVMITQQMQGFDKEGGTMGKRATGPSVSRMLSQRSNLMMPFLEIRKATNLKLDESDFLPMLNPGAMATVRAKFDNTNQTIGNPFLGALVFVQNIEPFEDPAFMERCISVKFMGTDKTDQTRKAMYQLTRTISKRDRANVYLHHMKNYRQKCLDYILAKHGNVRDEIYDQIKDDRLSELYAIPLTAWRFVNDKYGLGDNTISMYKNIFDFAGQKKAMMDTTTNLVNAKRVIETLLDWHFQDEIDIDRYVRVVESKDGQRLFHIHYNRAINAIEKKGVRLRTDNLRTELREHPGYIDKGTKAWFMGAGNSLRSIAFDMDTLREMYGFNGEKE